jgi:hypothetical protein
VALNSAKQQGTKNEMKIIKMRLIFSSWKSIQNFGHFATNLNNLIQTKLAKCHCWVNRLRVEWKYDTLGWIIFYEFVSYFIESCQT